VGLAPALLGGCATKRDLKDLQEEVRALAVRQEEALRELKELTEEARDSLGTQSDALFQLRGEMNRRFLEIQEQLVTLQELTGQSQRNLAALRDQIEARRASVYTPPATVGDTGAAGGGEGNLARAAGGAEETYNAAVTQFNRGSFLTARRAFEQFLTAYPNHSLAPDAQYYLAETLVQENRLEEAIQEFLRIPELFPASQRVPQALYRVGLLYIEL